MKKKLLSLMVLFVFSITAFASPIAPKPCGGEFGNCNPPSQPFCQMFPVICLLTGYVVKPFKNLYNVFQK